MTDLAMVNDLTVQLRAFVIEEEIEVDPEFKIYKSAAHALVDCVFSSMADYDAVVKPLMGGLEKRLPDRHDLTLSELLAFMNEPNMYATKTFNGQKISGKLKTDVVRDAAGFLRSQCVETKIDFARFNEREAACLILLELPEAVKGIGPALSRYLLILLGQENYIKPDSLLTRLLIRVSEGQLKPHEIGRMTAAVRIVAAEQNTTPARLENALWRYESDQTKKGAKSI